jgi:hypothetical protein
VHSSYMIGMSVFRSKVGQACTLVEQQTFTRFHSLGNASLNTIQRELSILNIGGGGGGAGVNGQFRLNIKPITGNENLTKRNNWDPN